MWLFINYTGRGAFITSNFRLIWVKYVFKRKILFLILIRAPSLFLKEQRILFDVEWTVNAANPFTASSFHSSLILQKHFLTHLKLVRHLMASIIITALFFLCRKNDFTSCLIYFCSQWDRSCKYGIKRFFIERLFTFIPVNID